MWFQETPYSCGAATIRNTLRALGIDITETEVKKLAGTTRNGTPPRGIIKALKKLKFQPIAQTFNRGSHNLALGWLHEQLRWGSPVILCVQNWDHWSVVLARLARRRKKRLEFEWTYVVIDSARDAFTPVRIFEEADLVKEWRHPKKGFYGISVFPR